MRGKKFYIGLTIFVFALFVFIVLMLYGKIPGIKTYIGKTVELEFWGVFDDSDVMEQLITKFQDDHPSIKITYKKRVQEYEDVLIDAMASGRGPDIFMVHNTWLPKHGNKIVPLSAQLFEEEKERMTIADFKQTFMDVAVNDFVFGGRIYALPLFVDTLALYYNKDIFNTVGIPAPPKTWDEFLEAVKKITVRNAKGEIIRAGAAMGTAENINRSTDIVALLMMQNGSKMSDYQTRSVLFDDAVGRSRPGEEALTFYTSFIDPAQAHYTWNENMSYSIDAFYEGRLGMMLNYAYHLPTIYAKAPYLNFEIAPVPQLQGSLLSTNYANYWGLAVASTSQHPKEAWEFLLWLSARDNLVTYLNATFRPTPRRDLVEHQTRFNYQLGVFASQALSAKSWYEPDERRVEPIFRDMIESVVRKETTVREALTKAAQQIEVLAKSQR